MKDAINLKSGMYFRKDSVLYEVISTLRTQMQQRRSSIRVKARELTSGKTVEYVYRADEPVDEIPSDEAPLTFLYTDGEHYHFMNEATYEQMELSVSVLGEKRLYLKENTTVIGILFDGHVFDMKLPMFIEAKVIQTEPGFKGDTVSSTKKPARLETGLVVQVPLFISVGDVLRVDTRTGEYVTRL